MKKKSLLLVLLIILACTCFVACGNSKTQSEMPQKPKLTATADSITVKEQSQDDRNIYEYSKDDKVWQDERVFSSLITNTEYTIYMRSKESSRYLVSPSSSSKITTLKHEKTEMPAKVNYTQNVKTVDVVSSDEALEYSFDGNTYSNVKTHSYAENGEKTILVRFKATNTHLASAPYELKVLISDFAYGRGTKEEPFVIKTKEQFSFTGTKFQDYFYYKLDNDLDFENEVIETSFGNIYGEFNGNGHTVKNVNINYSGDEQIIDIGLFSNVKTIKDLKAENIKIAGNCGIGRSPFVYFGLMAGIVYESAINCSATGTMELNFMNGDPNRVYIGGFMGTGVGQTINCFADADISISTKGSLSETMWNLNHLFLGGFAGTAEEISQTSANGSIEINSVLDRRIYDVYAGGLLGSLSNAMDSCYASTSITIATNDTRVYTGGLVGFIEYDKVEQKIVNSYSVSNIGILSAMRDSFAGGILGYLKKDNLVIENSFFVGNITNSTSGSDIYSVAYEADNSDMIGYKERDYMGEPAYLFEIKNCFYNQSSQFKGDNVNLLGIAISESSFSNKTWLETNLKWNTEIWEFKDGALPILKQA